MWSSARRRLFVGLALGGRSSFAHRRSACGAICHEWEVSAAAQICCSCRTGSDVIIAPVQWGWSDEVARVSGLGCPLRPEPRRRHIGGRQWTLIDPSAAAGRGGQVYRGGWRRAMVVWGLAAGGIARRALAARGCALMRHTRRRTASEVVCARWRAIRGSAGCGRCLLPRAGARCVRRSAGRERADWHAAPFEGVAC